MTDYRLIALLASVVIFTGYVTYITVKFGWLRSVSISSYHITRRYMFTLSLVAFSMLLALAGGTALMVFAAAGICFSGTAADPHNDKMTDKVHTIGATTGIVFGIASMIMDFGLWYIALPMVILTILAMKLNMKNHTFWIEIAYYYVVSLVVLFDIIKS